MLFRSDGSVDGDSAVPVTFTFATSSELRTTTQGAAIGTMFDEDCPDGEALRGFSGFHQGDGDDLVTGVQGHCGRLVLDADGSAINVEPSGSLTFHGETSPVAVEWMCPANEVVVGVWGNAGTSQDRMGFLCAPLTLVAGTVTAGTLTTLPKYGGDGGTAYDSGCETGQVARGNYGSYIVYVHSFGLVCAAPLVAAP